MTRLPGREIGQVYPSLSVDAKATALAELKTYLATIRQWKSPWGDARICAITGGPIRSIRVPNHIVGPYETSDEFHDYLLAPARNSSSFKSQELFEESLQRARKLRTLERPGVKFTHGDLKHHNILVGQEGHITGFLDWEAAGWYPDFWEYTTAMRYLPPGDWWYEFLLEVGAGGYREESECSPLNQTQSVDQYQSLSDPPSCLFAAVDLNYGQFCTAVAVVKMLSVRCCYRQDAAVDKMPMSVTCRHEQDIEKSNCSTNYKPTPSLHAIALPTTLNLGTTSVLYAFKHLQGPCRSA
ncbi:hypothetical protein V500_10217 [Pseudogymnoascus sp. VKM F-4518 (FW-2643)]|nr:hypothetical protein V500_10217 [Pseudogymnoascus sp. VKM F-4518 (FW-2643)]